MKQVILAVAALLVIAPGGLAKTPDQEFRDFCQDSFSKKGTCPEDICRLDFLNGKDEKGEHLQICSPKPCPVISVGACPVKYCEVMKDCSKEKICHYQMYGERPACGDLAYAGQDVACCSGLTARCGVEFFDGSCDMEGKNSIYSLPICIPCGDGICGNFENRCNCPEDCKNSTLDKPASK